MALPSDRPKDGLPSSGDAATKRRYVSPNIWVLGNVKALTRGTSGSCKDDGLACNAGQNNMVRH
jgi:hypothetical protein